MALITLTTDFGTEDAYVAEMKGVLCAEGPVDLRLVDLSHALPAQDLTAAYLFLEAAVPRFPAGTIHLAVIDPGVGSTRRALVVQDRDRWLVVPDNGIASAALADGGQAYAIDVQALGRGSMAPTFHGRDLFAPVAARLAHGIPASQLGRPINDAKRLTLPTPTLVGDRLHGEIIHVDHFGNLISNIRLSAWPAFLALDLAILCAGHTLSPMRSHYAQVPAGQPLALVDAHGRLEIAVRDGSAAAILGVGIGAEVCIQPAMTTHPEHSDRAPSAHD